MDDEHIQAHGGLTEPALVLLDDHLKQPNCEARSGNLPDSIVSHLVEEDPFGGPGDAITVDDPV